jgi:hypothetical protein
VAHGDNEFLYENTLKYRPDETFFNFQHLLLVSSAQITKFLYKTSVTPHQVILFSLITGILSSFLIISENNVIVIIGAVLLFYKNVLDKVDGSLARAKGLASRRGRFYDSISDFIVSFSLFTMIAYKLNLAYQSYWVWVICYAALITSMLQCSFFIYYEVAFIKQTGKKTINRLIEKVTEDDLKNEDKFTILLQKIFQIIYGWQDYLVSKIDLFFLSKLEQKLIAVGGEEIKNQISEIKNVWYRDKPFLSIASLLSIGSHMFFIALFAVIGKFEYYLVLNLIFWNLLLIFTVCYHYLNVKNKFLKN